MVGVFYWLFHSNEWIWACIVFVLAGITDLLDGYIARKYNMISNFGKLMDPLADKLMVLTAIFCLWSVHLAVSYTHLITAAHSAAEPTIRILRFGRCISIPLPYHSLFYYMRGL